MFLEHIKCSNTYWFSRVRDVYKVKYIYGHFATTSHKEYIFYIIGEKLDRPQFKHVI